MRSLDTEREMILDDRLRWAGVIPAALWTFHLVYNAGVRGEPGNMMWMCHVTTLLLAVGLIGSFASLIRLSSAWVLLGLPIWLVEALAAGTTRISVLSHVLVPIVSVVAFSQVGEPRRLRVAVLQSLALYCFVQVAARLLTAPALNVNLAHRPYQFFASDLIGSFAVYWVVITAALVPVLALVHAGFARAFPAAAPDGEQATMATTATTTPAPAPAPTQARPAPEVPPQRRPLPLSGRGLEVVSRADVGAPRGFSLLEVMIVVVILGVLAAIALPDLTPAIHNARLRASMDEVASFLERARRDARASGRCTRVRAASPQQLVLEERTHGDCFTGDLNDAAWTQIAVANTIGPGFRYNLEVLPASAAGIVFRPNGRLRGDGDLDIQDDGGRVFIAVDALGAQGADIVVTTLGRVCGVRVFAPPGPLAAPVLCRDVAFVDSGSSLTNNAFGGGGGGGGGGFGGGGGSGC